MYNNHVPQPLSLSNRQMGQMEPISDNVDMAEPISYISGSQNLQMGSQKLSLPSKRKAAGEPLPSNSLPHQPSISNKRVAQTDPLSNSPGSPPSAPNKKTGPRMVRNDSISSKSGSQRIQTPKNRTTQMEPSPKAQTESFEAVRSKMRESLAAALALVGQHQDKAPNEEKNSPHGTATTQRQTQEGSQPDESSSSLVDSSGLSENPNKPSQEACFVDKPEENRSISAENCISGQEISQGSAGFLDGDDSFTDNFFVKDDLLQGNGLSWAWDSDMSIAERKEVQSGEKPKLVGSEVNGDGVVQAGTPEDLAFKIEAELFKLFGGVNKKYKEKGRSLMFNLKDRNNPELRERVMSGDISPERLCSMTAEELASKELSEWRVAKAQEMAEMIVLPDLDVDVRRLVKKTHKGEYQVVEVDQDDDMSVEVSAGTTFTRIRPKEKEMKDHPPSDVEKGSLENQDPLGSITIPADGTDLMGLIVEEDAEFLPPIVSLDEFMESLDNEPPFENLPLDSDLMKPVLSEKENLETGDELVASDPASKDPVDTNKPDKTDKMDVKIPELEVNVKSSVNSLWSPESSGRPVWSPKSRGKPVWSPKSSGKPVWSPKSSEKPVWSPKSGEKPVWSPKSGEKPVWSPKSGEKPVWSPKSNGKPIWSPKSSSKPSWSPVELKTSPVVTSSAEHVWEGVLQLNISAQVTVTGLYRSGEKTSTKEWPSSLEIKGRVRLDAFEKFVQELPMSRSRAVMVAHFLLKEGSSVNDRASLSETVDSYVLDERLGFAEPAPGVELYFCPTHPKIIELLGKHLAKDPTEILKSTDNGLIGVLVWRKVYLISPNSSSHHKHSSKNKHFSSTKPQEKNNNINVNLTTRAPIPLGHPSTNIGPPPDEDEDDIPPGFGPAAAKDEDDLPEFNFSGSLNSLAPKLLSSQNPPPFHSSQSLPHPVNQMRELIQKYGQTSVDANVVNRKDKGGGGIGLNQQWNNDDDDDDIPEWDPQAPQLQLQRDRPTHVFHQPMQPHMINHPQVAPPANMVQQNVAPSWSQGARWVQPPGPHGFQPSGLMGPPNVGQYYGLPALQAGQPGTNWRPNNPRNRGFR